MIKKLRNTSVLLVFVHLAFLVDAQTPNAEVVPGNGSVTKRTYPGNYSSGIATNNVRSFDVTKPMTASNDVLSYAANVEMVKQTTQYFDGLGRPIQTVARGISPQGKDMVRPVEYDPLGREIFKYMPYVDTGTYGNFKANTFSEQESSLKSIYSPNDNTTDRERYFYGQTDYEASPLNRAIKTYAPGNNWVGDGVGVSVTHAANTSTDAVRIWNIGFTTGNLPTTTSTYTANLLYKTTTIDENGNPVIKFNDKQGRIVLKKSQSDATTWLFTYYVYDDFGYLRFVIPPKAVAYLTSHSWTFDNTATTGWSSSTVAQELCFSYEYDNRGRISIRRVPGGGELFLVYDTKDRLVMAQDENMRVAPKKWLYTQYDALNRVVLTGLRTTDSTLSQIQGVASSKDFYVQSSANYELLTQTFYDNYDWVSGSGSGLSSTFLTKNVNNTDYFYTADNNAFPYPQAITPNYQVSGAVTGKKTKVLGTTDHFLYAVSFYDDRNRLVQTQSTNYGNSYGNGTFYKDTVTMQYSFSGQLLLSLVAHKKGGTNTQLYTISTLNLYDNAGRLIDTYKKVGNSAKTKISHNAYNELGKLNQKSLGLKRTSLTDYSYTTDALDVLKYDYNVRGWLRGINKDYARNEGGSGSWFGMELNYDYGFSATQLNGNIAGIRWRSQGDGEQRAYGFNYDKANRLTSADFNQLSGSAWDKTKMDFSTTNLTYDENGNIKTMRQEGMKLNNKITIDNLTYNYTSDPTTNKLKYVQDATNDAASTLGDFKEITSNNSQDYWYDGNGNMTRDLNKNIGSTTNAGITYNYLNLPSVVTVTNKGTITYVYDAKGTKLQKITVDNTVSPSKTTVTKYVNLFTYQNDTLQLIEQEEGRIRPVTNNKSDTMFYDYFEKDHLGNVRVVLTDQKRQDVYPAATVEDNASTLAVEKLYYDIQDANRVSTPSAIAGVYANQNGPPPSNNNPAASQTFLDANSTKMYKLNGQNGKASGLGITIKVMSGDIVSIYGKSYYVTNGTPNNTYTFADQTLLNVLMSMFIGSSAVQIGSHGASSSALSGNPGTVSGASGFLSTLPTYSNKPKASINWALLDEQFQVVTGGTSAVSTSGTLYTHPTLTASISKNGYLYVFCSNESDVDVFFDNLQVIHTRGPLLEENHYYAFGELMAGICSKTAQFIENKLKGNGAVELQNKEFSDGSGLELYDATYRMYDPQIGRFNRIDPFADFYENESPYNFVSNNPISFSDPLGLADSTNAAGFQNSTTGANQLKDVVVKCTTKSNKQTLVTLHTTMPDNVHAMDIGVRANDGEKAPGLYIPVPNWSKVFEDDKKLAFTIRAKFNKSLTAIFLITTSMWSYVLHSEITVSEADKDHIFRDADGHFTEDTEENREALENTANDPDNFLGTDSRGNQWYGKTREDGKQIWVSVRNNQIRNGGVNDSPRVFDPETGLSKNITK